MNKGDVVRFTECLEDGDDDERMEVLELRGDRVLVRSLDPYFADWEIIPTFVHLAADLTVETCAS